MSSFRQLRVACLDAINDISSSITAVTSPKPAPPPPAPVPVVATSNTPMRRLAPTLPPTVEELTPANAAPSNLHSLVTARLEALKTRPLLSALFHSMADHGVRSVLCRAQAAIWAIDVITNVVAASVTEDRHVISLYEAWHVLLN